MSSAKIINPSELLSRTAFEFSRVPVPRKVSWYVVTSMASPNYVKVMLSATSIVESPEILMFEAIFV